MIIILPNKNATLTNIIKSLKPLDVVNNNFNQNGTKKIVQLSLPRFTIESFINLKYYGKKVFIVNFIVMKYI